MSAFESGSIRVLVGPLGSGKSEIAEEWFSDQVASARLNKVARVPIWFRVDELGSALEDKVIAAVGRAVLDEVGVDLVVDGLDERAHKASSVLLQADDFVKRWPTSRALITSRSAPNVIEIEFSNQIIEAPLLSPETSAALIKSVAGQVGGPLGRQLAAAASRPLFALLIARHVSGAEGVTGVPELIDLVVHDVVTAEEFDLYSELRNLAVNIIREGGPVDPSTFTTGEVTAKLRQSPLLEWTGRRCAFSLATFEQWFAAKALTEGAVSIHGLLDSFETFDRWKYVFAIVLAAGEPSRADPVMAALARWNPGAAAWIVKETRRGGLSRTAPDIGPEDWAAVGARFRDATSAWLDGLGPLAACGPLTASGSTDLTQLTIAVDIDSTRLRMAWFPAQQSNSQLPPVIALSGSDMPSQGYEYHDLVVPTGLNWVWQISQQHLAQHLTALFPRLILNLAQNHDGIVREEARGLAEARKRLAAGIPPGPTDDDLYPFPDIAACDEHPWGSSTIDTMHRRITAVATNAMRCYAELAEHVTPRFGDTLGHHAIMPARFYGVMAYSPDSVEGLLRRIGVGASWLLQPIGVRDVTGHRVGSNEVSIAVNDDNRERQLRDEHDAFVGEFLRYLDRFPACEPFAAFYITAGHFDVLQTCPATRLAVDWLWDDLEDLGWVSGPRPNFPE
ncbi:NACHT domain-containing protein [Mycobacteroides abscessus]|uniref:hypothetical protein n=1 Tax=Mycobacteroides abscessus TaxID=36809 RepID=UPI00104279A9|nr:hypothetical protein [Mycobacteroides abscessus]